MNDEKLTKEYMIRNFWKEYIEGSGWEPGSEDEGSMKTIWEDVLDSLIEDGYLPDKAKKWECPYTERGKLKKKFSKFF